MHRLERGDEDAGQVPDGGRLPEIGLHEDFDAPAAPHIFVAHRLGHLHLHVKGQLFRGTTGQQMQMAAHRPEERLRLGEGLILVRPEHALGHQLRAVIHVMDVFRDPEERMQVAQPPFAFLHVGLHHIAFALFEVPLVALLQLCFDEFAARP